MIYRYIFFSSLSVLSFEVLLLRIFSIRYSYHYASLVLSIAMMGSVVAAVSVFMKLKFFRRYDLKTYVVLLSLSFLFVYIFFFLIPFDYARLVFEKIQLIYLFFFILLSSLPFCIYAMLLSLSLVSLPDKVEKIYAFDLLGASSGILLPYFFFSFLSIEQSIPFLAFLSFLQIAGTVEKKKFFASISVFVLCFFIFPKIPLEPSPYKAFMQTMREEGSRLIRRIDTLDSRLYIFENPRLRYAPGLSFLWKDPIPSGLGISIDGEIEGVILKENAEIKNFLSFVPSSLPYMILEKKDLDVLIVGFRNSLAILSPIYLSKANVSVVERDSSIKRFVEETFKKGSIYRRSFCNKSARSLLKKGGRFDIVFLSRLTFSPSYPFGLTEDFHFTVERMRSYIEALRHGGMLYIEIFVLPPPRAELRLFLTVLHALRDIGIKEIEKHLIVIRTFNTISFLVKKDGLLEEERQRIERITEKRGWEIVFPTSSKHVFVSTYDFAKLFSGLMEDEGTFVKKYPFDISPPQDDRPFFSYFLRLKKVKEIYEIASKKWVYFIYEGMTIPFVFLFLLLISMVLFLPFVSSKKNIRPPFSFLYFFFIGCAFMALEVFFIHKATLFLESPSKGFCLAVFFLLFFSGMGSFSSRYMGKNTLFLLMGLLPILLFLFYISYSLISFFHLLPLFFLLGLFFPAGLKGLVKEKGCLPLAYAINGCASIISPPLSFLLSTSFGFRVLLPFSGLLYLSALSLFYFSGHRHKKYGA